MDSQPITLGESMKAFLIVALFISSMAFAADQAAPVAPATTEAPAAVQQGAVNPSAIREAQVTEQKKHHHKKKHHKTPAPAASATPAPAAK